MYYQIKSFFIFTIALMILLTGCATQQQVKMVRYDMVELRSKISKVESKVNDIEKKIPQKDLGVLKQLHTVKREEESIRRGQSQILNKLQKLNGEIQRLNNRIDEVEFALGSAQRPKNSKKTVHQELMDMQRQIKELYVHTGKPMLPDEAGKSTKEFATDTTYEPPPAEKPIPVKDDKVLYKEGREAYDKGDTKRARELFELILREYPESDYADNSRYWIGECYYKEGDFESAIITFEDLLRINPESPKAPSALLKQGYSFYKIGDQATGRYTMEKLIEKYPKTEEAKLAKNRIGGKKK